MVVAVVAVADNKPLDQEAVVVQVVAVQDANQMLVQVAPQQQTLVEVVEEQQEVPLVVLVVQV